MLSGFNAGIFQAKMTYITSQVWLVLQKKRTYTAQLINSTIMSKNIETHIYTDINLAFIVLLVFFTPNKGMGLNLLR